MTLCSKPSCRRPGSVILEYDYADRRAFLWSAPPSGEMSPHLYQLCVSCAGRLTVPQGWELVDDRAEARATEEEPFGDQRLAGSGRATAVALPIEEPGTWPPGRIAAGNGV